MQVLIDHPLFPVKPSNSVTATFFLFPLYFLHSLCAYFAFKRTTCSLHPFPNELLIMFSFYAPVFSS